MRRCDADGSEDEEHEGTDLFDAFEDFSIRSQRRIQELLDTTERKSSVGDEMLPDAAYMPAYLQMSDRVRLSKPPQFEHWQSAFPYLHVTGTAIFPEPLEDYIHIIDAPETVQSETDTSGVAEPLTICGQSCVTTPGDVNETNEEIILADGFMEEMLAQDINDTPEHWDSDDERNQSRRCASCPSPRATRMNEIVDALTFDCFSSTVAPMTLLQKQQMMLSRQREAVERAARRAVEDRIATEQAERLRQEQLAIEQEELALAVAKAAEEEVIRETERIELARQLQREENDDEEIKIRTLAYSHTREWYQPHKKCFSHRGRQLYDVPEASTENKSPFYSLVSLRFY
uniref:Uncharacterized protein n=1 Tax=Globisporangium ultimum (strain ATCC 200006 / CBS 805.95 / DAOM BR144) TaxID=431595 RepID=K3X1S7_GLOUD